MLKNKVGALGGRKSIFSMLRDMTLFLVVIIGMSLNNPKQLYFLKDNYKQKQCDILLVRMITGIMHFNLLLWWLP